MDFEVTATRKRPKTLGQMVGQDFVVATLGNALTNDQVAHAYLFSGPRGTGKTSTARILARSLNCENGPTATPCGTCSSCVEIAKGSSPDVIEIDGASNTSVNDVREIKDEVLYAPQSSRKKVYIIDEVHMLSNSAFNALLKTIEEPPPYIVFIFATTEVHKVPATIRSRCQQFRFRLFSPELIRDKLVEAAGEMGREFETDAMFWIAREAGGSMRDAYTLFDQVMSFSEEKITLSGIREKMGLVGLERTSELLDAASAGNRKRALEILDDVLLSGTAVEQVLLELADFLRNLLLLSYGIEKESLIGLSPERFPQGPRTSWDSRKLEAAAEDAFSLFRDIRYSMNPRYELELFIGRLCSLTDKVDPAEVLERIAVLRQELLTGDWSADPSGVMASEVKKKTPEPGLNTESSAVTAEPNATNEAEAEKFFSAFKNGSTAKSSGSTKDPDKQAADRVDYPTREEKGEPSCAVLVEIGTGGRLAESLQEDQRSVMPEIPPEEEDFKADSQEVSPPPARLDPRQMREVLIGQIKKGNMTLAAALEKATNWSWDEQTLVLTFASSYEAALVKNEAETLRQAGNQAELRPFSIDTKTDIQKDNAETAAESMRVELVRQVFRGQVMKG